MVQDELLMLMNRAAITDVVTNLAHAQDDKDWETMRQLFAHQVHLDMSRQSDGPILDVTPEQLADLARATLDGFDCTQHFTANLEMHLDGARARCRVHVIAYHQLLTQPGVTDFCTMRGYWHLVLRKTGERWLIEQWAIERAAPWEGDPSVYQLAAAAAEAPTNSALTN
jgi:SnoaL-like domain